MFPGESYLLEVTFLFENPVEIFDWFVEVSLNRVPLYSINIPNK